MYNIKCTKKFKLDLNIPNFSNRYYDFLNSDKKNIIIIKDLFDNSTFRYRGYNIIQTMENNQKYHINCFLVNEIHVLYEFLDKIDLVILQRTIWTFEIESFINVLKSKGIRIVYDVDDLIYHCKYVPDYLNSIGKYDSSIVDSIISNSKRFEDIANIVDGYITTTEKLKINLSSDFNKPVWVFHNYLNLEQEKVSKEVVNLKKNSYSDEKFIIGYFSGSWSHKRDLEIVEPALLKLMNDYDDIYLKIVGYMDLSPDLKKFKNKGRIINSKFVPFEKLQYEIGKVDLNIIPLQKHEFNNCKSELKYFEASIVNTLTCATDNIIYKNVIEDGVNGFLSNENSWFEKIENIYLNQGKFDDIINNARIKCLTEYGNKNQETGLEAMYDDIINTL